MPAVKKYTRINFQNYPSTSTPLNATNLNKMDKGIDDLDDEVVAVKNTIENMSFDADSISYNNTSSGLQATDVQGAVDEINDNLSGFKFYPTGTAIVGLVADDSAYTDSDGNYIIASSTTGQSMIDNVTYKSINSTEDLRGKVGADTASPFSGNPTLIESNWYDNNTNWITISNAKKGDIISLAVSTSSIQVENLTQLYFRNSSSLSFGTYLVNASNPRIKTSTSNKSITYSLVRS